MHLGVCCTQLLSQYGLCHLSGFACTQAGATEQKERDDHWKASQDARNRAEDVWKVTPELRLEAYQRLSGFFVI